MRLSTFPYATSALLASATALGLLVGPAPAHAQADASQPADGWVSQTVLESASAVVRVEAAPSSAPGQGFRMPDERTMEEFLRRFGDEERRGPQFGRETGPRTGSGFAVGTDGLVVTASELVAGSDEVEVTLHDGTSHDATVVGRDPESGIAVLRIETDVSVTVLEWGEAGADAIGTEFVALARSEAFGTTAWTGRLAAIDPTGDRMLIDDPLDPSATGAPLIGPDGTVVGVAGVGGQAGADASIALSSAAAREVVDELSREGAVSRGYLGVQIQSVTQELADALGLGATEGALVTGIQPGAPAEAAGLRGGDVILSLDGEVVTDPADLSGRVAALEPGETVQLELWRENARTGVEATLAAASGDGASPARDAPNGIEVLGLTVADLTPDVRNRFDLPDTATGVAVLGVGAGDAAGASIREGDLIVGVQRQRVSSVSDLQRALEQVRAGGRSSALLLVQRGQARSFVVVQLQE